MFASIYGGQVARAEELSLVANQKREERLAAHDATVFARYQAGDIGDDAIIAYIRKRLRETRYDPRQQAEWRKALIEYTEAIADNDAARRFEQTNDYGAYLAYLRAKLADTKDSAGRLEITRQIRSLIDDRDSRALRKGAQAIVNRIALSKADSGDLIDFYRTFKRNLRPGSPLRADVQQALTEAVIQRRQQTFETNLAKLEADHSLTPVQRSARLKSLISDYGLIDSDPARYYQLWDQAEALRYTPDPADLAKLDYQLAHGDITPDDYEQRIYQLADRLQPYDPQGAWQMRTDALQAVHQYAGTALSNPGEFEGQPGFSYGKAGPVGGLKFKTQLDGTAFAQTNCTQAAAAMLAYSMGIRGLSGGDLRYLTGDRAGGTSLDQAEYALRQVGVSGLRNRNDDPIAFERFTERIRNGAPAVLMGVMGNVPADLRASPGLTKGHALFIAKYDPKRDAFLVMDPAVSKSSHPDYHGAWWSASAVRAFGWGRSSVPGWSFHGQAMFAPPGTVSGGKGEARNVHWVSVDDPPQRKGTPKSYHGLYNGGASGNNKAVVRNARLDPDPVPSTVEEAKALLDKHMKRIDQLQRISDAYTRGETHITIGGEDIDITPDMIRMLDHEVVDRLDREVVIQRALGEYGSVDTLLNAKDKWVAYVAARNTIPVEQLWNGAIRDADVRLGRLSFEADPTAAMAVVEKVKNGLTSIYNAYKTKVKDPLVGIDPTFEANMQQVIGVLDIVADPSVTIDDKRQALLDLEDTVGFKVPGEFKGGRSEQKADDLGQVLTNIATVASDKGMVDRGEAEVVIVDGQPTVVPYTGVPQQRIGPDGSVIEVPVLDLSGYDVDVPPEMLPQVIIQTPSGPKVVKAIPTRRETGFSFLVIDKKAQLADLLGKDITNGDSLTYEQIGKLGGAQAIERLIGLGVIERSAWSTETIVTPDWMDNDGRLHSGAVWWHDDGTRRWYQGRLPTEGLGNAIPGLTDVIGVKAGTADPDIEWQGLGHLKGVAYPVGPGVSKRTIQTWVRLGIIDVGDGIARDVDGKLTGPADDADTMYWTPPQDDRRESIELAGEAKVEQAKTAWYQRQQARMARDRAIIWPGEQTVSQQPELPGVSEDRFLEDFGLGTMDHPESADQRLDQRQTERGQVPQNPFTSPTNVDLSQLNEQARSLGIKIPQPEKSPLVQRAERAALHPEPLPQQRPALTGADVQRQAAHATAREDVLRRHQAREQQVYSPPPPVRRSTPGTNAPVRRVGGGRGPGVG